MVTDMSGAFIIIALPSLYWTLSLTLLFTKSLGLLPAKYILIVLSKLKGSGINSQEF